MQKTADLILQSIIKNHTDIMELYENETIYGIRVTFYTYIEETISRKKWLQYVDDDNATSFNSRVKNANIEFYTNYICATAFLTCCIIKLITALSEKDFKLMSLTEYKGNISNFTIQSKNRVTYRCSITLLEGKQNIAKISTNDYLDLSVQFSKFIKESKNTENVIDTHDTILPLRELTMSRVYSLLVY